MGVLDMLLDNSDQVASLATRAGVPAGVAKQALDKIVPFVKDKVGSGGKKAPADEEAHAKEVAASTGLPLDVVKKLMADTEAAHHDPRFIAADLADGVLDGKIGTPKK